MIDCRLSLWLLHIAILSRQLPIANVQENGRPLTVLTIVLYAVQIEELIEGMLRDARGLWLLRDLCSDT